MVKLCNVTLICSNLAEKCIHFLSLQGLKRLCSAETMGRGILGFAAVETTRSEAFRYNIWTSYGGISQSSSVLQLLLCVLSSTNYLFTVLLNTNSRCRYNHVHFIWYTWMQIQFPFQTSFFHFFLSIT